MTDRRCCASAATLEPERDWPDDPDPNPPRSEARTLAAASGEALVARARSRRAGTRGCRVRSVLRWLAVRHSLRVEAVAVVVLYVLYEASRSLVVSDAATAVRHAGEIVLLERRLHIFVEGDVQSGVRAVPGLLAVLAVLYLTLHLAVTGGYLLWLHRRRARAFPVVRTALLLASGLALIGYLGFPAAPPRLAGLGIADAVSNSRVPLDSGLVSAFYNPFAAIPSVHVGYASIVAGSLFRHGRRRSLRLLALGYPALVLLVIVATGNHFLIDAAAGAALAAAAALLTLLLTRLAGGEAGPAAAPASSDSRPPALQRTRDRTSRQRRRSGCTRRRSAALSPASSIVATGRSGCGCSLDRRRARGQPRAHAIEAVSHP